MSNLSVKQLSVSIERGMGSIARVTGILANHGINMAAVSVVDTAEVGILRIIVNRSDLSADILRNHGYKVNVDDVACIKLNDVAGSLHNAMHILARNEVNVEYTYAYNFKQGDAVAVIGCDDCERAISAFQSHGVEIMTSERMM